MTIQAILDRLIGREGDYVDHPADRGGPTRWGITEQVARAYGYTGPMRALPQVTARNIYTRRYWSGPGFDQVALIYPKLAEELMDTGVNMGPAVAAGFLQRSLNVLNKGATVYPDMVVDGRIGPMTIAALRAYAALRGAAGERVLFKAVDSQQGERYHTLAEQRPANEAFTYGWFAERLGELS